MSKTGLIKKISEVYYPDWEPAPSIKKMIGDVERLYELEVNSVEYLKLKSDVLYYLSMNCIEQFERGKYAQGKLTRGVMEDLFIELSKKEGKK